MYGWRATSVAPRNRTSELFSGKPKAAGRASRRILNRLCADACSPGCIAVAVMFSDGNAELSDKEFDALVFMARA
jgi:hypothetical protein